MATANNSFYTSGNTRYAFIDGLLCDTIDKVYATLQSQLSIPDYFGHNLDALEEVLADLEWVEEKKIKLVVINTAALLANDSVLKGELLSILENNDSRRLEIELA
jgi:RNAse (barnase) inhibitor barstar